MKSSKSATVNIFRMDVLINDDSMKCIFQLKIRTHFGHASRELVVEVRRNY